MLLSGNIYSVIKLPEAGKECFESIFSGKGIRVEKIYTNGSIKHPSKWYEQDEDEWVLLLEGEAVLEFEGEEKINFKKGDFVFLPALRRHRLISTSNQPHCIWLGIFGDFK